MLLEKIEKLQLNEFTTNNKPFSTVMVSVYETDVEVDYKILVGTTMKLNTNNSIAANYKNKIYVLGYSPEKVGLFRKKTEKLLQIKKDYPILRKLANKLSHLIAKKLGYPEKDGQKFISSKCKIEKELIIIDSILLDVDLEKDGRIALKLDPCKRWIIPFDKYLNTVIEKTNALQGLQGQTVYVPSFRKRKWFKGTIDRVEMKNVKEYKISSDESLYDFWMQTAAVNFLSKFNIAINAKDNYIVYVNWKDAPQTYAYPSSILRAIINLSEIKLPQKKFTHVSSKVQKIQELGKKLANTNIKIGNVNFSFSSSQTDVLQSNYYSIWRAEAPRLQFGNGGVVDGTTKITEALKKFGPYCDSKEVNIILIYSSDLISEFDINILEKEIEKNFRILKLGKMRFTKKIKIPSKATSYLNTCVKIRVSENKENSVVLAIIPNNKQDCYRAVKKGLKSFPSKIMTIKTFNAIIKSYKEKSFGPAQIFSLCIFWRSLSKGECPIILNRPAGGISKTLVFSIDFSRDIIRREEMAADIIAINSYGEFINPVGRITAKGEFLSAYTVKERIQEIIINLTNSGFIKEELENLVYIHDGDLRVKHTEIFVEGFTQAIEELVSNKVLEKSINLIVIDVSKNINFRIFGEKHTNPSEGTYLIKEDTAYLVASKPKEKIGATKVLRIRIKSQTNDKFDIHNIVQLINDLRYLDFVSPYTRPRLPIVQHLAHKKSKLTRVEPEASYLP